MREILFRGKRKNGNHEWIYGNLNYYPSIGRWFIRLASGLNSCDTLEDEVAAETIGQYTGLTDKNGNKIFEGDVVEIHIADLLRSGVVIYAESAARVGIIDDKGKNNFSFMQQPLINQYGIKVIGNVHDNPELLKGERK